MTDHPHEADPRYHVVNRDGKTISGATAKDYPIYARCGSCGLLLVALTGGAEWVAVPSGRFPLNMTRRDRPTPPQEPGRPGDGFQGTLNDITAPAVVEVEIRQDGSVVWVSVDGVTVFRACRAQVVVVTDHRDEATKQVQAGRLEILRGRIEDLL